MFVIVTLTLTPGDEIAIERAAFRQAPRPSHQVVQTTLEGWMLACTGTTDRGPLEAMLSAV